MPRIFLAVVTLACFFGPAAGLQGQEPTPAPAAGGPLEHRAPAASRFDPARLELALRYAAASEATTPHDLRDWLERRHAGDPHAEIVGPVKPRGAMSGLVARHGSVVAHWGDVDRVDMAFSITKSFLATVAGVAWDAGLFELDEPVAHRVRDGGFDSAQNAPITWRQLLQQTSEWEGTLWGKPDTADRRNGRDRRLGPPGSVWEYNDVRINRLALSLLHLLGRPLPEVLHEAVMAPIGASRTWRWHGYESSFVELEGRPVASVSGGGHWGGGLWISTRDLARFGLLHLRGGLWGERRIVSEEWIERATTPAELAPTYGFLWWLNTDHQLWPSAPAVSFAARGGGDNVVWIDPAHDLVVVVRWIERGRMDGFLARLLAAIEPPVADPRFADVTATHLPAAVAGPTMDAAVGDVDGDGDLDLVLAEEHRQNILLLNDGTGHFTDASDQLPRAARDSEDVGLADLDGDGDLDAVVVSEDDSVNELYLNDGTGRFTAGRLPVAGRSNALALADLDGDGSVDLLIGNHGQNHLLLNDGGATFRDATAERLPAIADRTQDLELGDVDGDGDLDLVAGNEDRNRLYLNDGRGVFTDVSEGRLPLRDAPEETREADFGDVDGDGDLDLVFGNIRGFVDGAEPRNRLLLNDGTGRFVDVTAERLPADAERSFDADLIDVDGDGDLDLVTANAERRSREVLDTPYRLYLNDGAGNFVEATARLLPASARGRGFDIEAADFDGDGRLDLYLASRGSSDRLLLAR